MLGIAMFLTAMVMLLAGFPVAFTFAGVALFFGLISQGPELFALLPFRIFSTMKNDVLMAIPLFIYMGIILQRTQLAEQLLIAMGRLFGPIRGGIAISTVLVGALLAASTGVVGASVVAMGLISLPVMLRYQYSHSLACGTICASGTLGQIIPPSIVLIILGDVLLVSVGDLFRSAALPGLILVAAYIVYILAIAYLKPNDAPVIPFDENESSKAGLVLEALKAIIPPLLLIIIVLGSIFKGVATPTESSALGCLGAMILALVYKKLSWGMIYQSALETVKVTAMVFTILIGATAFAMVFVYSGGEDVLKELLLAIPGEKWGFIIFAMVFILLLGFFIDFVEISFIVLPLLYPIAEALGINMVWFAILVAINLQTSFLTPPFGFSLFYLKGVAPKVIKTSDIYRGAVPFIVIQILILLSLLIFPEFYGLSTEAPASIWD